MIETSRGLSATAELLVTHGNASLRVEVLHELNFTTAGNQTNTYLLGDDDPSLYENHERPKFVGGSK